MAPSVGSRLKDLLLPGFVGSDLTIVLAARLSMSAARAIAGVVTALYLARIGFSAFEIGLLFVGVSLASALVSSLVGLTSDRLGRKPFLVAVPLVAAAAAAGFAFLRDPAALFLLAAAGSFGRGAGAGGGSVGPYQPAESALVAELVESRHRSAAFGRISVASSLGALAGGLLAALARPARHLSPAAVTAAYRPAFLAAAVLAALAGLLALGLAERRPPASPPGGPGAAGDTGAAGDPAGDGRSRPGRRRPRLAFPRRSWPALWRLWITNSTNGLAIGAFGSFLSYWLARRYGATPATIGELFAAVNFATLVSGFLSAGVAARLGTVRAIVAVRAATAVLLVPMVLAPSFWAAGAFYLVRMVIQRIGLPLRQSYTQDLAHPEERASLAALSQLPAQATMAGGQVLAGYLFDEVSLAAPFELAAFVQALNALAYWLLFGRATSVTPAPAPVPAPAAGGGGQGLVSSRPDDPASE